MRNGLPGFLMFGGLFFQCILSIFWFEWVLSCYCFCSNGPKLTSDLMEGSMCTENRKTIFSSQFLYFDGKRDCEIKYCNFT